MSKSKKNAIDPETMISQYGADAVRWFILSDSPPEKDIQWSNAGVISANKFLQKVWDLNSKIKLRRKIIGDQALEKNFIKNSNNFTYKIDQSINQFRFNVSIALFYENFNFFKENIGKKISNDILIKNFINFLKLMIPFTPHVASECLELHGKNLTDQWPKIEKIGFDDVKIAVQVNGKTRDVLSVKKNILEEELVRIVEKSSKANKYTEKGKIIKIIYVKNKIINYIIK